MAKVSFIEKIKTLAEITRPVNILMIVFGVLVTLLAGLRQMPPLDTFVITLLVATAVAGAGNAINDYYDANIDRVNRPHRPLPSGRITQRGLWAYAIVLFCIGIVMSLLLPFVSFAFALVNSILLAIYAYRLKRSGFFGDLVISYLVASVFIFAATVIGSFKIGFILAVAAFFTNAAREVLKDLEDIKGDRLFGAHTLPLMIGRKKALIVVSSFLFVSILVSPLPYTLGILNFPYMLVALITDAVFAYIVYLLYKNPNKKSITLDQKLVKVGSIIGLVAFLAGVIPI